MMKYNVFQVVYTLKNGVITKNLIILSSYLTKYQKRFNHYAIYSKNITNKKYTK